MQGEEIGRQVFFPIISSIILQQIIQILIALTIGDNFKIPNDPTYLEFILLLAISLIAPKVEENGKGWKEVWKRVEQ